MSKRKRQDTEYSPRTDNKGLWDKVTSFFAPIWYGVDDGDDGTGTGLSTPAPIKKRKLIRTPEKSPISPNSNVKRSPGNFRTPSPISRQDNPRDLIEVVAKKGLTPQQVEEYTNILYESVGKSPTPFRFEPPQSFQYQLPPSSTSRLPTSEIVRSFLQKPLPAFQPSQSPFMSPPLPQKLRSQSLAQIETDEYDEDYEEELPSRGFTPYRRNHKNKSAFKRTTSTPKLKVKSPPPTPGKTAQAILGIGLDDSFSGIPSYEKQQKIPPAASRVKQQFQNDTRKRKYEDRDVYEEDERPVTNLRDSSRRSKRTKREENEEEMALDEQEEEQVQEEDETFSLRRSSGFISAPSSASKTGGSNLRRSRQGNNENGTKKVGNGIGKAGNGKTPSKIPPGYGVGMRNGPTARNVKSSSAKKRS
eukprot:TRINITY_DN10692_c0_g1_i4.p1 TRINITY_DN10692_c0_g1~~TRINITY_DN10692_c0_g1_i4.p1  ORF type:complete len:417 (-),score=121.69 TRINITY_DN10692_c0_g1_i4:287-1537(-)